MKKTFKKVLAIVLSITTVFSCMLISFAETGDTASNGVSFDVLYDKNGDRIGFKTITIKDKVYYDVFGGQNTLDGKSLSEFYKTVLSEKYNKKSVLDIWSQVAEEVYRIGGPKFGYNWEYGNYDQWFDNDQSNSSSNIPENGDVNVQDRLSKLDSYYSGKPEEHNTRVTGYQLYSSLSKTQEVMLDEITTACGEEEHGVDFKEEILDHCTPSGKGFDLLNKGTKEEPVLANIITTQYDYDGAAVRYSSFGMAFYDFELTPIVEKNIEYISAADDYASVEEAFKNNVPGVSYIESDEGSTSISYIQNPTSATSSVNASASKSVSYSVSNSFSESESYTFSEALKTNVESGLSGTLKLNVGLEISTSQAISTAYSEDKSFSESVSTSSSVGVELPPYTEIGIKQTTSKAEQSVEYNCPVYVTYKVVIFAMNGQYIQGGDGTWGITNYDQGGMCVAFGTDTSFGGVNAPENLFNRLEENSSAFEMSCGNVEGMYEDQNDGAAPEQLYHIDWSKSEILEDLKGSAKVALNCIPMSSMGGTMVVKTDSINSEITQIYPLYDLKRIRFEDDGHYTLGIGGKLDLNTVNTIGLNEFDRPYYGYLPRMGTWYVCDKNGNTLPAFEEGKGIVIEPTPSTQTIIANEPGDYYVRFDIDEQYYTKASDRTTYITNDDLEFTAILKLSVTDTGNNHVCREGSWVTYIPSNCVIEGERYKYCLTCSKRMAVEVIPKAEHTHVEIIEPATCISEGSRTVSCAVCKAVTSFETIDKLEHTHGEWIIQKDATCVTDGIKTLNCADCSMILESEVITSAGHDGGVWEIDFEATADHDGQMSRYCSKCDEMLETKTFKKHEHTLGYESVIKEPTCTANGEKGLFCAICDAMYSVEHLAKNGHGESFAVTSILPTCTTAGEEKLYCTDCGMVIGTNVISETGHSAEWLIAEEATCTKYGREEKTCTSCGTILETRRIDKEEHLPGKWEITLPSSCTQSGLMQQTCGLCGVLIGEPKVIDPHEHQAGSWVTVVEAACEKEGEKVQNCTVCNGALATEVIPALSHSFTAWHSEENGLHSRTCLKCGVPETNNCDYAETVTAADCSNGGYTTNVCTVCENTYISDYTLALGHSWGNWSECADGISHERECHVCGADEKENHNWSEWVENDDAQTLANGTKSRICVSCGASETVEAENSSFFGSFFRSIVVFFGNISHKLVYIFSLNWLFPELTITK